MVDPQEQKLDMMKQEIDALQVAFTGMKKPAYKDLSLLISLAALLFSFATTWFAHARVEEQEIQSARQELRVLLQRLAALPKELALYSKELRQEPMIFAAVNGLNTQETALLARQAAEIATTLPQNKVSAGEDLAIALALQAAYETKDADRFLQLSLDRSKDFGTEITAVRITAANQFMRGTPAAARKTYDQALAIFSKYPGYDAATQKFTHALTEQAWAVSEAQFGNRELVARHLDNADRLAAALPADLAVNLRGQLQQVRESTIGIRAGALPGAAPPVSPLH